MLTNKNDSVMQMSVNFNSTTILNEINPYDDDLFKMS